MKVLFYYYFGGGGGFANIKMLLNSLARDFPQDQYVLAGAEQQSFDELRGHPNVRIHTFPSSVHREVARLRIGVWDLPQAARKERVDVLWAMNLGPYLKAGVPTVISVNNGHQVYPEPGRYLHPKARYHVQVLRWFFRRSLGCSDGAIVQTPLMGEYVRRAAKRDLPTAVIPKAVESDADIAAQPLREDIRKALENGHWTFTFLYAATGVPHKNHRTLVDAFELLAAKGVRARVVLTIAKDELVRLGGPRTEGLADSGHLIAVGWVGKEHLRALYQSCDGCLMPSLLESLSSAHLEAMAWSKPQISADVPFARDLCGPAALYAEAESASDWAAKIEAFMGDAQLRQHLAAEGTKRMSLFPSSWGEMAMRVRGFLQQVIEATPKRGSSTA